MLLAILAQNRRFKQPAQSDQFLITALPLHFSLAPCSIVQITPAQVKSRRVS